MDDDIFLSTLLSLTKLTEFDNYKKANLTKEIVKLLQENPKKVSNPAISSSLDRISVLYFTLDVRDPLKKALKSLFSEVRRVSLTFTLKTAFCQSLSTETKSHIKLGCENILSCLDNFPAGSETVISSLSEIWQFLHQSLSCIHKQINLSPGPEEVTVLFNILQSIFKAISLTIQECNRSAVTVDNDLHVLLNIYNLVLDFLISESTLLNSRLSSGIVVANLFKTFFAEDVHKAIHIKELCLGDTSVLRNVFEMEDVIYPTMLCAWGGLLASLTPSELTASCYTDGHSLLNDDIFLKIIDVQGGKEDPSILLAHARTIALWTEKACLALRECDLTSNELAKLTGTSSAGSQLFSYVWSIWDHFMDGVRFHARTIFENTVKMHLLSTKEDSTESLFLKDMCSRLLSLQWYQKGKYGALSHLVSCMGYQTLLNMEPELPSLLIEALKEGSLASHVSELVCALSESLLKEVDHSQWQSYWLGPLLHGLGRGTKVQRAAIQQQILSKLFRMDVKILPLVIQHLSKKTFLSNEGSFAVLLSCLKIAKSSKMVLSTVSAVDSSNNHKEELWKDCLSYTLLETALCYSDEQVRLDALGLICDSPKTSEAFLEEELELIKTFIQYNINVQSPAFRQKMLGFFKKFLNRINDSAQQVLKKLCSHTAMTNCAHTLLLNYQHYLDWLWSFLFSCLHPEANFSRRGSALQIIILIKEIIGLRYTNEEDIGNGTSLKLLVTPSHCQTILECLRDTYETNKQLGLQFLSGLPIHLFPCQENSGLMSLLKVSFLLASSIRPPDSITAAYLFQAISLHCKEDHLLSNPLLNHSKGLTVQEKSSVTLPVHFALVSSLLEQLKKELATATVSLLSAAAKAPMYGLLACIRYLLVQSSPKLSVMNGSKEWESLISQLIEVCMEVTAAVEPVVCNASPEGHLPMDTNPESVSQLQAMIQKAVGRRFMHAAVVTPSELINPETSSVHSEVSVHPSSPPVLEVDIVKTRAVTAQMLLLCSWRAHREVSLLLGHLCQNLSIEENGKPGLLSPDQVKGMGSFFIQQLSEIKHRGAFEEAYVGFCKLCYRLWRCESSSLHELPKLWLGDLLLAVSSASDDAMCLTRRSAGVPFIVQALLINEPEGANGACFKDAMASLLQLAIPEGEQDPNFTAKSQVHALNILRALYREANLGEMVMPYVADGLRAAIIGFKGETWMLRNAAMLLLSTLITRVFGVNRSRETELQRKNCMTGRVFFQRFPTLFPFLLEELKNANLTLHHIGSTYPVLLLLSRLYPSPMEGCDSYLQLGAFLPYVERCGRSNLHLTRRLAAKALVPLLSPDIMAKHLSQMFHILTSSAPQNCLHGTLLQISSMIEELSLCPSSVQEEIKDLFPEWFNMTMPYLTSCNWCTPVKAAYLDMVWVSLSNGINLPVNLSEWLGEEALGNSVTNSLIGDSCYQTDLTRLYLATYLKSVVFASTDSNHLFTDILPKLLCSTKTYETRMMCLDFLSWLLDCQEDCLQSRSLDMVPLKQRHAWFRICDSGVTKKSLESALSSAFSFYQHLQEYLSEESNSWCRTEIYYILCVLTSKLEGLLSVAQLEKRLVAVTSKAREKNIEDEAVSMLHYSAQLVYSISHLGFQEGYVSPHLEDWCTFVYSCCQPEGSTSRRQAAAQALHTCSSLLNTALLDEYWEQMVGPLWDSYILLLQDDEPDIRERLLHLIQSLTVEDSNHPVLSSMTVDLVLGQLIYIWGKQKPMHVLALLLNLALRSDQNSNFQNNKMEACDEQPFDKGELNVFAEEVAMSKLACKHLKSFLDSSFPDLDLTLKLPCLPWIAQEQVSQADNTTLLAFIGTCFDRLSGLSNELSRCTIESVFVCHLFDSLCIQIFQQASVLKCILKRVKVLELLGTMDFFTVILEVESWPYRNQFLDNIMRVLKELQQLFTN